MLEAEQLDGSLDAPSPIPPSPSTSTGLSSQTEISSQVEDVTRNPSQVNPLPVSDLQMKEPSACKDHTFPALSFF